MAITPPYIRLSNGDIITFEKLGPKTTAVLSNSEGVLIRKGNALIGATEKELANTIILGYPDPKPTIIEEVSPPPKLPSSYVKLSNGDVITFEKLGPKTTAVLSNSTGILIRKGNPSFSVTEKVLAEEIILGYEDPKPTIVEEVLPPPPPPKPKPTPEEVESKRLQEAKTREQQQSTIQEVNVKTIEAGTPQDAKAQGSAKLGAIITEQGKKIQLLLIPVAYALALSLGASLSANLQDRIKQKLAPNDACPNDNKLNEILNKRNALVNRLNRLQIQLNRLTIALTGLTTFLSLTTVIINALKTSKKIISAASKLIPSPPGVPGIITSIMGDLDDLIRDTTFTGTGAPKLEKVAGSIASASLSVSIINGFILTLILLLRSIDSKILECNPNLASSLTSINPESTQIAELQLQAEQTQNNTTYKGFIIEIEIIPYTPTVNRRRAVGKNQNGIILIQTELSFTTDDQILINELKFIIDRDNLKAY